MRRSRVADAQDLRDLTPAATGVPRDRVDEAIKAPWRNWYTQRI
jgi:hypothetical protein